MRTLRFRFAPAALGLLLVGSACESKQAASAPARDVASVPAAAAQAAAVQSAAPAAASLPVGRYVCYRLSSYGDEVIGDLFIDDADTYRSLDAEGTYRYSESDKLIEWEAGPLHQPSEDWVGVFTPEGAAVGQDGGRADDHRIEIRRRADVQAGNMAAMQRCHFAE